MKPKNLERTFCSHLPTTKRFVMADFPTPPVDMTVHYEKLLGKPRQQTFGEGRVSERKQGGYARKSLLPSLEYKTYPHP